MCTILQLITFTSLLVCSLSQGGSLYAGWPSHCCRLETRQIQFGDQLPEDYVQAGETEGERWAYVVDKKFNNAVKLKSEKWDRYPLYPLKGCVEDRQSPFFDILVNPNRCALNFVKTRFFNQTFPQSIGNIYDGGRFYAPAFNGHYFATMNESTYPTVPAYHLNGRVDGCRSYGSGSIVNVALYTSGHGILTVDCLNSLVTMSNTVLLNVTYPEFKTPTEKSDVVYFHRTYKNSSPQTQKQKVGFSVERTNTIHVSLSQAYAASRCDFNDNSFSSSFGSTVTTEAGVGWGPFSAKVSASVSSALETYTRSASNACKGQSNNSSMDTTQKEVMKYSFSDEVTVPANSVTTVKAFTTPFKGTFDYQMTYKLSPRFGMKNATRDIVMAGLKFFKMADHLELNKTEVIVKFDGKLFIDSGYEVTVDVVSVPIEGEKDNGTRNIASYNLISNE